MDRVTRLIIQNVRAIERLELDLGRPITVLIGVNGSGKSTILECLELLRKAAEPGFMQQFYLVHRGMGGLLRAGAAFIELGVVIEDDAGQLPRVDYRLRLTRMQAGAVVQSERLLVGLLSDTQERLRVIWRDAGRGEVFDQRAQRLVQLPDEAIRPDQLVIASFGNLPPHESIGRLLATLRGVEVHLGFDTLAAWAAQSVQRSSVLRGSSMLLPTNRLSLLGHNLASAWSALKNMSDAHWQHTLALVRLGLGDDVDSVSTLPDAGGGNVGLSLRRAGLSEPIPAANLSDGHLVWLAFVALARLNGERTLFAIDEPELHLHPALLGRVMALLADIGQQVPVMLCTHSDRVLELLEDASDAVRVCGMTQGKIVVQRLDPVELSRWLEHFGDLGQLRASGYLERALLEVGEANTTSSKDDP